jgi:excisionase family DNA binding protein
MTATFYTARELQEILSVDRTTIYRMADAGRIPAVKVGSQWRFPRRRIDQWIDGQNPSTSTLVRGPVLPVVQEAPQAFPLECVQLIQDTFADALGVMIVTTNLDGNPLTRMSNAPGLIRVLEEHPEAQARCLQSWAELARLPSMQPTFLRSHLGLLCARAFFRTGSELRGMVVLGGCAPQPWPPTEDQVDQAALTLGIERGLLENHLSEVWVMDAAEEARILGFTQRIADVVTHVVAECGASGLPQHVTSTFLWS